MPKADGPVLPDSFFLCLHVSEGATDEEIAVFGGRCDLFRLMDDCNTPSTSTVLQFATEFERDIAHDVALKRDIAGRVSWLMDPPGSFCLEVCSKTISTVRFLIQRRLAGERRSALSTEAMAVAVYRTLPTKRPFPTGRTTTEKRREHVDLSDSLVV